MTVFLKAFGSIICASLLAGCAIHPLPEDVASLDTYAIVRHIRCEARDAILRETVLFLNYGDNASQSVRDYIAPNQEKVLDKRYVYDKLSPNIKKNIDKYFAASLSIEFQLKMTENDNLGGEVDLLRPLGIVADAFNFTGSANRQRQNFRTLRITDGWGPLIEHNKNLCEGFGRNGPDYSYPIAGQIGLFEMIDTYVRTNELSPLGASSQYKDDAAFVDDLLFTTTLSAGLTATRTDAGTGVRHLFVKSAKGAPGVGRTDEHRLIIALYIPSANKHGADVNPKSVTNFAIDRQIAKPFYFGADPFVTLQQLQRQQ